MEVVKLKRKKNNSYFIFPETEKKYQEYLKKYSKSKNGFTKSDFLQLLFSIGLIVFCLYVIGIMFELWSLD